MKRFIFIKEDNIVNKINQYYEFPIILDMNSYTKQFIISNENYDNIHNLNSVIIHASDSINGYYYSLIKEGKSNK